MLFNSYAFWGFFLLIILLYRWANHRVQNTVLLVGSYVFYGCWDWRFLPLIAVTTLINFYTGIGIEKYSQSSNSEAEIRKKQRILLTVSIVASLGMLGFFKYWGFFIDSTSALLTALGMSTSLPVLEILLPVGISFYTFQTMSYTIDVYRGETKPTRNLADFALYVAYFPQLVAGPIERSSSLLPQILKRRERLEGDFTEGLSLVMMGLFMKVVVADNLSLIANGGFSGHEDVTGADALMGIYAFAFQIYGDFAGYSLIARGVSKWLGIDLMTNFRMPYLARNPSDFWQRWHISLSSWLRDYLYIPLGGNRGKGWRIYRNLMLTMLIGGLWHGAGWTFVCWGGLHGILLCIYRPFGKQLFLKGRFGRVVATMLFFQWVCLTWLLFRAENMSQVWSMLQLIVTDFTFSDFSRYAFWMLLFLAGPLMLLEIWQEQKYTTRRLEILPWGYRAAIYCYFIFMLIEFPPVQHGEFIYFQF